MICNKCANIFDDSLPLCPECGWSNQQDGEGFVVSISEESFELLDSGIGEASGADGTDNSTDAISADSKAEAAADEKGEEASAEEAAPADEPETADGEKADAKSDSKPVSADEKKTAPLKESVSEVPVKKAEKKAPDAKKAKSVKKETKVKETKEEKSAYNFIISLVSVMGALLIALCVVGFTTDVFKQDEGVKAVALLGLTSEEEKSLENHISAVCALIKTGFDSGETSASEFLDNIHPGEENGMFKKLGKSAKYITDEADPAQRFIVETEDEYGEKQYSYYKTEKWQIDSILESFGINPDYTLNSSRSYYYDGYYYFSCENCWDISEEMSVDITQSKRIQDGSYYAVCSVIGYNADISTVYVIAEKVMGENEERSWKITKIQKDPIFDSIGIMIDDSDSGDFAYEMKTVSFESVTENGKTLCQYTLQYPVFKGDSVGEKAANTLYDSIIATYKSQAENAEADYKKFKKDGYDESSLPLQLYFTADVTYNKGDYISVINDISKTVPVKKADENAEDETQDEIQTVAFAEKALEGYTFDVLSGEYVTKDTFVGKEYLKIEELLYRIYNGYDYSGVMSGENIYDEVPEDTEETGKHFYEGASVLCDEGYAFYAVCEEGYTEKVVIPFSTPGVFSQTF